MSLKTAVEQGVVRVIPVDLVDVMDIVDNYHNDITASFPIRLIRIFRAFSRTYS